MSVDHTAHAIIGVRIDARRLYESKSVRGCEHERTDGATFCSVCGRPVWEIGRLSIPDFFPDGRPRLAGWDIIVGYSNVEDSPTDAFVGVMAKAGWNGDSGIQKLTGRGISAISEGLKASLEPLGLWDENWFGLWAVLYTSC